MSQAARALTVAGATLALAFSCASIPASSATGSDLGRAERWGPVRTLAANAQAVAVAVDGRGTTTAVWATSRQPTSIMAKQRTAGGHWGRRIVLGHGRDPHVVADPRGSVTVVWITQRRGSTDGVAAARRPAGGPWRSPVQLAAYVKDPGHLPGDSEGYGATELDLAVNPRGALVATWAWGSDDGGVPWRVQSAYRPPAGPWRAAVDVTPPSGARQPEVGLAADGTAVLVYGRQRFGEPQVLLARRRAVGSSWSTPRLVTPEGYSHDVAVDRAGDAVTVFTPDFSSVHVVAQPAGRRWEAPRTLSRPGAQDNEFALAMSAAGRALVVMGGATGRIDVVEQRPDGPWSRRKRLAGPRVPVSEVVCSLNASGEAFVGWGSYGLYGKYRSEGTWSRRYTLSPDAGVDVLESAASVVAPDGDIAVAWDQEARPLKLRFMNARIR